MKLTNGQIYVYYEKLSEAFKDEKKYLPAKINFLIQKNLLQLSELAETINNTRIDIIYKYGQYNENQEMVIPKEKIDLANDELKELLNIAQEIEIYTIDLKDIEKLDFTPAQMNALLFMITDLDDEEVI